MFVVLGASGNTGKVVAETLLRQKKKVRVVLHDAPKEGVGRSGCGCRYAPRQMTASAARRGSSS